MVWTSRLRSQHRTLSDYVSYYCSNQINESSIFSWSREVHAECGYLLLCSACQNILFENFIQYYVDKETALRISILLPGTWNICLPQEEMINLLHDPLDGSMEPLSKLRIWTIHLSPGQISCLRPKFLFYRLDHTCCCYEPVTWKLKGFLAFYIITLKCAILLNSTQAPSMQEGMAPLHSLYMLNCKKNKK